MPTKSKKATNCIKAPNMARKTKELKTSDQKKVRGGAGKTYSTSNFDFKIGGLPENGN